eukprot:TRINITY_DN43452_c0_g1_i1.p1 TRINITY_DN43452_c0_g1~~TRINITY_DN43452_c0_g1_i1.p1  ORF type:complete len:346 (-),score=81.00 TRINITY_DN43452_c0_g1_i1:415-1452(-)
MRFNAQVAAEADSLREMSAALELMAASAEDVNGDVTFGDKLREQASEGRRRAEHIDRDVSKQRKQFKVVIVLPVMPCLEKNPAKNENMRNIVYWQQASLFRGKNSLMKRLQAEFPGEDLDEYIGLYNLKHWGRRPADQVPVCETVYVHSKVMIVDDRVAILGSANINDRSLAGDHDSELAVVCSPPEHLSDSGSLARQRSLESVKRGVCQTTIAGQPWEASVFAQQLRIRLWAEHLGLADMCGHVEATVPPGVTEMLTDPIECYNSIWFPTAAKNTIAFDTMFPQFPSDDQRTYKQVNQASELKVQDNPVFLHEIKGYIARMPLRYLESETLYNKRFMVPDEVFT